MITMELDPRPLIGVMNGMESQLPFAVARALNECGVAFQNEERQVIGREFIIRRPWVLQGVKINRQDFATKAKPEVRIHIDPQRDFLGKFERGGIKTPRGQSLAVPIGVRSSPTAVIPTGKRPRAFNFREVGASKHMGLIKSKRLAGAVGRMKVYEGDKNTIMLRAANGTGVILQRVGRSKKHGRTDPGLQVLYVLRKRTPVPADLHFYETARRSFAKHWPAAMGKWWNESVRTANTGRPIVQGMSLPAGWTE